MKAGRSTRWWPVGPVLVAVFGIWMWQAGGTSTIEVPADHTTIAEALNAAPDGSTIRVAAGVYDGPIVVDRPVTLVGMAGGISEIRGDGNSPTVSVVNTSEVTLRGLTITGGDVGVLVRNSTEVLVSENTITGNYMRGVRVVFGSARIIDNLISNTSAPGGKGIHVANALSWPESVIAGNVIEQSDAEGIVTNMARTVIENNTVRNNLGRGIAINEMSISSVLGNSVTGNGTAGILVLDMSMAEIARNDISAIAGDGIRLEYHAEAHLTGNEVVSENGCVIFAGTGSQVSGTGNQVAGSSTVCGEVPFDIAD